MSAVDQLADKTKKTNRKQSFASREGFVNVKGFDDSAPEVSYKNMRKLKSAYRHPFEHINPRLY